MKRSWSTILSKELLKESSSSTMKNTKVIAFYLPQYHPTPNNDIWWGKGFTEWTNVAKARKLYLGHYQPKIPADLGFYDLRLPEVKEEQATLARQAGIDAFCYYHYWFQEGHEELDIPFKQVVSSGKPDFPFCLCWANESWYSKFWNKDGSVEKKVLAKQQYLGQADNEAHFLSLLSAFKDKRYLRIHGRLVFLIYKPLDFKNFGSFKKQWNDLAIKNGLPGFYFIGQTFTTKTIKEILDAGFDAVNHCFRLDNYTQYDLSLNRVHAKLTMLIKRIISVPYIIPYKKAIRNCIRPEDYLEHVFPTMMPNWDHTPRSSSGGTVLHNSTPELFKEHANKVLSTLSNKSPENRIVFLKSWNEWGEGNYMEPDLKFGKGYINALKDAIDNFNAD